MPTYLPIYRVVILVLLFGLGGCGEEHAVEGKNTQEPRMEIRSLEQLLDLEDPGWPLVQEWIAAAKNPVEVLPSVEEVRGAELLRTQVTTRSPMGALVYETGGLLVDHGWLRVLGSGHPRLPRALGGWNEDRLGSVGKSGMLLVADDVLGGSFAVNGGALPGKPGSVFYFESETGECEDLELNYSQFLIWALSGDHASFYEGQRWNGWEADVKALPGDQAFTFYPLLSAQGPAIEHRQRSPAPLVELISFGK